MVPRPSKLETDHDVCDRAIAKGKKDLADNEPVVENAKTRYDEALSSLRQAKKKFNTSYLNRNSLEELPDSEEPTYNDYSNEQKQAVKKLFVEPFFEKGCRSLIRI